MENELVRSECLHLCVYCVCSVLQWEEESEQEQCFMELKMEIRMCLVVCMDITLSF